MAYPTTAAIQGASPVTELSSLDEPTADSLRDLSIKAIEVFCGQSFIETTETLTLGGTGTRSVPLPKRLVEITDLTVVGSSLDASDVLIGDNGSRLYVDRDANLGYYAHALRDDLPPLFPFGADVVTIQGTWGWTDAELPAADLSNNISLALRLDMEAQAIALGNDLTNTVLANQKLGIPTVNSGPLRSDFDPKLYPMTLQVQELLRPYRWQTLGFAI